MTSTSGLLINKKQFFPTQLLAFCNNLNFKKMNKKIANYVIEQSKKNPDNKTFSLGGHGWHSDINLTNLDYDWSKELHAMIIGACSAFAGRDLFEEKYILETWAIKLSKGGYSNYHSHPGFRLSGVYYVKVPSTCDEKSGSIAFPDTRAGAMGSTFEMPTLNFKASEGEGLVFESWLPHYVTPHNGDECRISVSWNIIWEDLAKDSAPPWEDIAK